MPQYLVSAPRPDFDAEIVGVRFRDGAATVDPDVSDQQRAALAYFERAGYAIALVEADEPTDAKSAGKTSTKSRTAADEKGAQS